MNKQIDLSNTGGFPLEEDTLAFLQESYTGAFAAIAKLCGDKTILHGVVVTGANVSNGWISYNGELMPFIGGAVGAKVSISTVVNPVVFEDLVTRNAYFTKTASSGIVGDFDFSELAKIGSLSNIWLPGDLKQKYVDNDYISTNFDNNGFGLNKELGWRILSSAVPAAAGKVFVNLDSADDDFNNVGNVVGAKTHKLLPSEQGNFTVSTTNNDPNQNATNSGFSTVRTKFNGQVPVTGAPNEAAYGEELVVALRDTATAHNIIQPSFTVLTLIKL